MNSKVDWDGRKVYVFDGGFSSVLCIQRGRVGYVTRTVARLLVSHRLSR